MIIESVDRRCRIEIERVAANDWPSFSVAATVDLGHARFAASNDDVALLRLSEFMDELDRFISDRSLAPRLEGTYDTQLTFRAAGLAVVVDFVVGGAYTGFVRPAAYALSGNFEVAAESLPSLSAALSRLAATGRG